MGVEIDTWEERGDLKSLVALLISLSKLELEENINFLCSRVEPANETQFYTNDLFF